MGEDKEDKFASLMKLCQPTPSQESKLRNCPFACESEAFWDSSTDLASSSPAPTPSEPPGIVMVSLPDSSESIDRSTDHDEESEFQTPPEHRLSSSEYESVDGAAAEPAAVDIGCTGGEGIDNLCEVNSGTGVNEVKRVRVSEGGLNDDSVLKRIRVSEELDLQCERETECHGKTEHIVIESEGNEVVNDTESEGNEVVNDTEVIELESEDEPDEKTERENLGDDSRMRICMESGRVAEKGESHKIGESKGGSINGELRMDGIPDMIVENGENGKSGKICECAVAKVTAGEKSCKKGDREGGLDGAKKVEEIEKFKYVPSAAVPRRNGRDTVGGADVSVGGRRKLPSSIEGIEKNVRGAKVVENGAMKKQMDFLDVLKIAVGDVDDDREDVDFLEIAKRRGLTFPRPRWWPPEGVGE